MLSAYENGRREPSARTFRDLLRAAGAELTLADRWDTRRNGKHFELVMQMTDHLPQQARGEFGFPSFKQATRADRDNRTPRIGARAGVELLFALAGDHDACS